MYEPRLLDSVQSSQEALSEGLELPETSSDGRIVTLNNYGAMKLGAVFAITTTKFIEIASTPGTAVLDIGAAYGETCLEALKRGATDYTANDIEPKHLKILARRVAEDLPSKLPNLKLISGGIPHPKFNDFIPTCSLDAVLLDSILHFLDPVQVTEALHQIFSWLKPGGKVFALMGTINLAVFKSEVRENLERDVKTFVETVKTQGQIDPKDIPGFTSNVSEDFDFSICPKETLEAQFNFSDGRFFRFHLETAKYLFETAGFIIEEIVYTPINTFPYKLNGKERVAVFAKKP